MKKLLPLLTLPLVVMADDWSWTFKWGTNDVGVVFENTNLTASVKSAIRDDFAYVLSYNIPSTAKFEVGIDTDSGKYAGRLVLDEEATPDKFPAAFFQTHNGTNYFAITHEDSTNYLAQIALTNQYRAAISGLSNFVHTINHATTGNLSRVALVNMYWNLSEDRVLTVDDISERAYLNLLQSDRGDIKGYTYVVPSILDLAYCEVEGKMWFMGVLRVRSKLNGRALEQYCAYRKGKWRLIFYEGP